MPSGRITPHFTWEEAKCRCGECEGWNGREEDVRVTAEWAEQVRLALGGLPLMIHSWVRCESHNREVGGEPNSQHLLGRAIDFSVKRKSPATVQKDLRAHFPELVKGLGSYPGFTHADRRTGEPALWRA